MLLAALQVAIVGAMRAGVQVGGQTPAAFLNLPRFQVSLWAQSLTFCSCGLTRNFFGSGQWHAACGPRG